MFKKMPPIHPGKILIFLNREKLILIYSQKAWAWLRFINAQEQSSL